MLKDVFTYNFTELTWPNIKLSLLRIFIDLLLKSIYKLWLQEKTITNRKVSRARFWSSDLWVMGPARFHCATLLLTDFSKYLIIHLTCLPWWLLIPYNVLSCLKMPSCFYEICSLAFSVTVICFKKCSICYNRWFCISFRLQAGAKKSPEMVQCTKDEFKNDQ